MMKSDSASSLYGRWTILLAVLIAAAGLTLSLYLRARIATAEAETVRLSAEALRLNTEQEMIQFVDVLESVRALHALSDAVNQEAMDEFIAKGLVHQHAVLGTFGLAQQIDLPLRFKIEKKEKNQPGAYDVVQRSETGEWVPAQPKPVYYPLTWQSRSNGLHIPIGFDLSSEPAALNTIQQIERTRRTSLVPEPIPFSEPNTHSYWVFSPVIAPRSPASSPIIGLAVAVFEPNRVLRRVTERSIPSTQLKLHLNGDPGNEETVRRTGNFWQYRGPLRAMNTDWEFECSLPAAVTGRRSETAFITGLVITALLTSLLLLLGSRTRKVEAEVLARTKDLRAANRQLEESIRERVHMEEEINELAAKEQRRIGRDLHDSLGQKLTGAVFLSRSLLNHLKSQKSDVRDQQSGIGNQETHAETLNMTLKDAVAQVRNMARGLASVTLNDESLEESLQQLAEEMSLLYDIPCNMTQSGQVPALNRKTKEQLYFIAREAVNNAARHANPKKITIHLTGNDDSWSLQIQDDGCGLPEERDAEGIAGAAEAEGTRPANGGMGLRIMRHRTSRIDADFSIESLPGKGTTITVQSTQ